MGESKPHTRWSGIFAACLALLLVSLAGMTQEAYAQEEAVPDDTKTDEYALYLEDNSPDPGESTEIADEAIADSDLDSGSSQDPDPGEDQTPAPDQDASPIPDPNTGDSIDPIPSDDADATSLSSEAEPAETDIHRLSNATTGEHLYTIDRTEIVILTNKGWRYEGVAWSAPTLSATPVYRLSNGKGIHAYLADAHEITALIAKGWQLEGIAWYSAEPTRATQTSASTNANNSTGNSGTNPDTTANETESGISPIYRAYDDVSGMHFLTASAAELRALLAGSWVYEGVSLYGRYTPTAFDKATLEQPAYTNVYRLYNQYTSAHLFTASKQERNDSVAMKWRYEGIVWRGLSFSFTPVYRLYSYASNDYFYTSDLAERLALTGAGWAAEGIAWYAPDNTGSAGNVAGTSYQGVYRLYNPEKNLHFFLLAGPELNSVLNGAYRMEGVGWASLAPDPDFVDDMQTWNPDPSGDPWLDQEIKRILASHPTLRSVYDYVAGFGYRNGDRFWSNPRYLNDGVTIDFASDMISHGSGNCYRFASLFSWLARGLGYSTRVVSGWVPSYSNGRAPHGWVEVYIDGQTYICDPDLQHEIPSRNWYLVTYSSAPTYYGSW